MKELTLRLPESTINKAKEAGIELSFPLTTSVQLKIKDNAVPDVSGVCIGHANKNTGVLESFIDNDDKYSSILQSYIDNKLVDIRNFSQRNDEGKLVDVPHFFIIYEVAESSKYRETYTEDASGYGMPLSGHYECEYEVLLGTEEYTRRMIFKTETVNISMCEWLESLIEELENEFDDESNNFYEDEYGRCFTMFDNCGIATEIEFDIDEFKSMIVGVRQLSCKFIEE